MKLTGPALEALRSALLGDKTKSPYMSGPKLYQFFRQFGYSDVYPMGGGAPSRWQYVEGRLFPLNGKPQLAEVVEAVVDPRRFDPTQNDHAAVVAELNRCLRPDGYELVQRGQLWKALPAGAAAVTFAMPVPAASVHLEDFIADQIRKCEEKLKLNDSDGAVTNSRSLIEAILQDCERKLTSDPPAYDGDVSKLYKRVRKALKLDAADYQEHEAVQQLLRGLVSIVDGLAGMSNDMSDRHAGRHRAQPHHARLAVNAANTFCSFVVESYRRQRGDDRD